MMKKTARSWWRRLGTILVMAVPLQLVVAGTKTPPGPSGPEDDLGTLPATSSDDPPLFTGGEDDLGTLPITLEDPAGPHLTFTGPVTTVPALLAGISGPGDLGYRPGPSPGTVTAVLDGEVSVVLRLDDPRLVDVKVAYVSGDLPTLGELRSGPFTSGAFLLQARTSLPVPVRSFLERSVLFEQRRLELDLLDLRGVGHGLSLRLHGAFLLLDQTP